VPVSDGGFAGEEVEDGGTDVARGRRDGGRGKESASYVGEAFGGSGRGAASVSLLEETTFGV